MSDPKDDLFDDPEARKVLADIQAHGNAIYELISRYADAHELSDEFVSDMAFEAGVYLRVVGYLSETAKPSAAGLKLDLDRCRRNLDDVFREYKRTAEAYVRSVTDESGDGQDRS